MNSDSFKLYAIIATIIAIPFALKYRKYKQKKMHSVMEIYFRNNGLPANTYFFTVTRGMKEDGFVAIGPESLHMVPSKDSPYSIRYDAMLGFTVKNQFAKLPLITLFLTNGQTFAFSVTDFMKDMDGLSTVSAATSIADDSSAGAGFASNVIAGSVNSFTDMLIQYGVKAFEEENGPLPTTAQLMSQTNQPVSLSATLPVEPQASQPVQANQNNNQSPQ